MIKSIADLFNNPNAVFNDPYKEIHNPVERCDPPPELEDYDEFLSIVDNNVYPVPSLPKRIHNAINPLHGKLKPICIKI